MPINRNYITSVNYGRNGRLNVTATDTDGSSALISTSDAKSWAKVETSADDTLIGDLIDEVTTHIETKYGIPLRSKDVVATWDSFGREVPLPYAPVSSITTVKEIDSEGNETTLTENTDYRLVGDTLYFTNPNSYLDPYYRVSLEVTYVSAYDTVPNDLVLALKKAVLSMYEDRQDIAGGMTVTELPNGSKSILKRYKRLG